MSTPEVLVHRDASALAQAIAARLVTRIVDVQASRGRAHISLTGGALGASCLAHEALGRWGFRVLSWDWPWLAESSCMG